MSADAQESALTPREIVAELDRYIVGQNDAKRAVAIALRNRWRRRQVHVDLRDEITPKNIIMIGPTGVGKTEIARRLARLARAPFTKVEASKFTEVGYVGRDVESMVRDLVEVGIALVREEHEARVEVRAAEAAEDRILSQLRVKSQPAERPALDGSDDKKPTFIAGSDGTVEAHDAPASSPKDSLRARLRAGEFDNETVEIELADAAPPMLNVLGNQPGAEQIDLNGMFGNLFGGRRRKRKMTVGEARRLATKEEAGRLLDMDAIHTEALQRAEQSGIIFIDELDKVAGSHARQGADVSREGVQRDLLPIVEGSTVTTKYGAVKTDHILFIAAGAFSISRPSDLIPELQGRFPIRVELRSLTRQDFERILTEPANALTKQYVELMRPEGVYVRFDPSAIATLAEMAERVNASLEDIGARRLHTILEKVFEQVSFDAPDMEATDVLVDDAYVRERLEDILEDQDLSRYIL